MSNRSEKTGDLVWLVFEPYGGTALRATVQTEHDGIRRMVEVEDVSEDDCLCYGECSQWTSEDEPYEPESDDVRVYTTGRLGDPFVFVDTTGYHLCDDVPALGACLEDYGMSYCPSGDCIWHEQEVTA